MADSPCLAPGCTNAVSGRYCSTHRYRLRVHGTFNKPPKPPSRFGDPVERFHSQHDVGDGCWRWTGATDREGYGVIRWDGRSARAHRVAWFIEHGDWPAVVMHRCDNPACVRLDHLAPGTNATNGADSARKQRRARGRRNVNAKLTEGQVLVIRERYAVGDITQKQLADAYGISHALVSYIVNRRLWAHI